MLMPVHRVAICRRGTLASDTQKDVTGNNCVTFHVRLILYVTPLQVRGGVGGITNVKMTTVRAARTRCILSGGAIRKGTTPVVGVARLDDLERKVCASMVLKS